MLQAITTKFLGPTDHKDPRVKATAQAGSVTILWNDRLDVEQNHLKAAKALQVKYGWNCKLVGGGLSDGYVFVQVLKKARKANVFNL